MIVLSIQFESEKCCELNSEFLKRGLFLGSGGGRGCGGVKMSDFHPMGSHLGKIGVV